MYPNFLTEELMDDVRKLEQDIPFLRKDPSRKKRWDHLFEGSLHQDDEVRRAVDIMKDPVLDHYHVSPEERIRRRLHTEQVLDQMVMESMRHQGGMGVLHETTTTGSVATNAAWQLPMVRKIWPRQFLWEITSMQTMNQPQGRIYFLDFQYGTAGGAYAAATSIYDSEDPAYADDLGEGVEPREINLKVTGSTVTARSKKLKAVWNIEAEQDLSAYHNMALEPEVVKMLGQEIERENNRYCINLLRDHAYTNTNWSSTQPGSPLPWANATPREYAESLWDAIEDANKAIKDQIYVDANFILCGTSFATRLRKLNSYRSIQGASPARTSSGPSRTATSCTRTPSSPRATRPSSGTRARAGSTRDRPSVPTSRTTRPRASRTRRCSPASAA
jgi:hypothetical protein